MRTILQVLLAFSFEMRSGRISAEEMAGPRISNILRSMNPKKDEPPSTIEKLESRYPETDFDQQLISGSLFKALLFDGRVDQVEIRKELDGSPSFAMSGVEPAWRIVANCWSATDQEFEKALLEMESQFEQRKFTIPGEMFQVFGLRLFLSKIGIIKKTKEKIVSECKKYLNALQKNGEIKNKYKEKAKIDKFSGWGGYVFVEGDTIEFTDIYKHYVNIIDDFARRSLPGVGKELLDIMANDQMKFFRTLCLNSDEESIYYDAPVLAAINANEFVQAILNLSPTSQGTVFSVFKARYEHGLLDGSLKEEKEWLMKIKQVFERRLKRCRPLSKYRIQTFIRGTIDPYISTQAES
jgi:hypothetical protein